MLMIFAHARRLKDEVRFRTVMEMIREMDEES